MSSDEAARARFAKTWAAAVERALPPLNIEQGAARLVSTLRQREQEKSRSSMRRVLWAAAAAIALTALLVAGRIWFFEKPSLRLTIDGKQATTVAAIGGAQAQLVHFSDGSTIALDPKSALDVAEANAHRVAVTLKQGAANFDVVRGDASSWHIGAGPFQVRVLGTAFRVEWDAESQRFSLSVTRGAVRVSGPLLSGEQVISAGATCAVDLAVQRATFGTGAAGLEEPQAATRTEKLGPGVAPDGDAEVRPGSNEAEGRAAAVPTRSAPRADPMPQGALDWRELERQGQFDKAIQEAMRAGVDEIYVRASAEDLMGLARAARLAGRLDISGAALLSCRRRFAGTPDAAMAAYLLGRNAAPDEAARWFSTYLSEQPEGSLAREASGRLMEAHFRSGLREAARADARAYLLRYPSGPHADFANMVLSR
jgi:hypothetical protein